MGCTESTPKHHELLDDKGNITVNTSAAREAKAQHDMKLTIEDLKRYVGVLERELPLHLVSKIKRHRVFTKDLKGELKMWVDSEGHVDRLVEKNPFKLKDIVEAERELNLKQARAFPTEFNAFGRIAKPQEIHPPVTLKRGAAPTPQHVSALSKTGAAIPRMKKLQSSGWFSGSPAVSTTRKLSRRGSRKSTGGGAGGQAGLASPPSAPSAAMASPGQSGRGSFGGDMVAAEYFAGEADQEAVMFCGARVPELVNQIEAMVEDFCPPKAKDRDAIFARLGRIIKEGRGLFARKQADVLDGIARDPGYKTLMSELGSVIGREVKVTLRYSNATDAEAQHGIIFAPKAQAAGMQQVLISRVGRRAGMQELKGEKPDLKDWVRILGGPGAGTEAQIVQKEKDKDPKAAKGAMKYKVQGQEGWYSADLVPKLGHGWTFDDELNGLSHVKKGDRLVRIDADGEKGSKEVIDVRNMAHDDILRRLAVLKDQHREDHSEIDLWFLTHRERQVDEEHYPHCAAHSADGRKEPSPHVSTHNLFEPEDVYNAAARALPLFKTVCNEAVCRAAENHLKLNESTRAEDTVARVLPLKPFFSTVRRQALRLDDGCRFHFETATDIVRGSICADSCNGLLAVLRQLKQMANESRIRIVRVENYFKATAPRCKEGFGEAVVFLQCLSENSPHYEQVQHQFVCELRLVHRATVDAKEDTEFIVRRDVDTAEEIVEFAVGHVLLKRMRKTIKEAFDAYAEDATPEGKEACRAKMNTAAEAVQALRAARMLCAVNGRAFRVVGEELAKEEPGTGSPAWVASAMTRLLHDDRVAAREKLSQEKQKEIDLELARAANEPSYSVKVERVVALLMQGADPNAKADPVQAAAAAKARLAKASKMANAKARKQGQKGSMSFLHANTPGFDGRRASFLHHVAGSSAVQNYQLAHPFDPTRQSFVAVDGHAHALAKPQNHAAHEAHALDAHAATQQYTALVAACRQGHLQVVEKLLDHGAHIETADMAGDYPVVMAATYGRYEILQVLIERGPPDLLEANDVGKEAIKMAARHPRCLQLLKYAVEARKARPRAASIDETAPLVPTAS